MVSSIGKLDRRIVIQHNVATGKSETGQPLEDWQTLATVWARKLDVRPGTREFFEAKQLNAERSVRFEIRYRSDVTEAMRVLHNGVTYDITGLAELRRMRRLELLTTARRP